MKPNVRHDAPPAPRQRRWLRRLLLGTALVVVVTATVGVLLVRHYTDPELVRELARAYLQQHVTGRVHVGGASVSWSGQIRLHDVVIGAARDSSALGQQRPQLADAVLVCPQLELSHEPSALLSGRLDIKTVVLDRPVLTLVRDESGGSNITNLFLPADSTSALRPEDLPTLELREARLRVLQHTADTDRVVDEVTLTIRANRSPASEFVYEVVWRGRGRDEDGVTEIDLRTWTLSKVRGGLPWLSIEAVMFVVDVQYDGAGGWGELLGLGGAVRAEDYLIGPLAEPGRPRYVTIALRDASLSVPINDEEHPLGRDDRYLSFQHVNGRIRVEEDKLTADFAGLLHGATCEVRGTIRGGVGDIRTLDDVDFDLAVAVTEFTFPRNSAEEAPAEWRFIHRWPELTRFFADYAPRGRANLSLSASKKAGRDESLLIKEASLTVTDGAGRCRFFPYDVEDLTGTVEYRPEGIFIRDLRGRHGEGRVVVNGKADPIAPGSRLEIHVSGENILVDEDVRSAMPPRYRNFLSHFEIEGRADAEVFTRGPVHKAEWRNSWKTDVTVTLNDVSARYHRFPYPLEHVSGRITAGEGGMTVTNVQGRRGDARVGIDGSVQYGAEGVSDLDLAIVASAVPFDDTLLAALPPGLASEVSAFRPAGTFDANAQVGFDPSTGDTAVTTSAFLRNVTVRPERFPIEIGNIHGGVVVAADGISLEEVHGTRGEAKLTVDGTYGCGEAPRATDLRLVLDDAELTGELLEVLPADFREALGGWRVAGPIDAVARWRRLPGAAGASAATSLDTVVGLEGVSLSHPRFPMPFEGVKAVVEVTDEQVRTEGFTASYGPSVITGDLELGRRSGAGVLDLSVRGLPLDEDIVLAMPDELRSRVQKFSPTGVIDVEMEALRYEPRPDGLGTTWALDGGRLSLHDVQVRGSLDLRGVNGEITLEGQLVDRSGGLTLSGEVNLATAEFLSRLATTLQGTWSLVRTAGGEGQFAIRDLEGGLYGGRLMAEEISLRFSPTEASYFVKATARKVELEPFVNADFLAITSQDQPFAGKGRLDAQFSLVGEVGRTPSRRGTGGFEIRDAEIYRLPVVLAILSFIDPTSSPSPEAFNFAKAHFSVVGSRMDLSDVLLTGPVITFTGSGWYSTSDRHINLELDPRSRQVWNIPVITPMVDGTARRIVAINVTGPVGRPVVSAQSLPGVNDTFKDIFRRKKGSRYSSNSNP